MAHAMQDLQSTNANIWVMDLTRGVRTRYTFDLAEDDTPVWSPDGSRIVFSSNRKGHFDLYVKNASGAASHGQP